MKKNIVRKDLVVGIIALFIGLAFIPSFNAVSMSKTSDDTTPPVIEVTWETSKFNGTWYVKFDCEIYDNESGIDRAIFYLNGVEQEVYTGPGPFSGFHFTIELSIAKKCVFKFEAINSVGLSAFVEVDGLDIKSNDDCGCSDGDDYPIVLCAILWYQMFFATLLFMKTGWDVPMKILNAIGIKYNCPHFG